MTELDINQFSEWLSILSAPTFGVVAFIVLILYRDAVIHIIKTLVDILASWLKRK